MDLCSKNAVLNVSDFESKVKEATNRLFSVKISLRFEGFQRLDRLRSFPTPTDQLTMCGAGLRSEAWGPSGTVLHEIAAATTDEQQRTLILQTLYDRLRCARASRRPASSGEA